MDLDPRISKFRAWSGWQENEYCKHQDTMIYDFEHENASLPAKITFDWPTIVVLGLEKS